VLGEFFCAFAYFFGCDAHAFGEGVADALAVSYFFYELNEGFGVAEVGFYAVKVFFG